MGKVFTEAEMDAMGAKPVTLTPEQLDEMGATVRSKHPTPKSMTQDDQSLGLMSGPIRTDTPADDDYQPPNAVDFGPELSPVEKRFRDERRAEHPFEGDIAFLKEAAPFAAGGALGKGASMLLGRAASGASPALARGADATRKWIENAFMHGHLQGYLPVLMKAMYPGLGGKLASATGTAARGTAQAVSTVAPAAGAVAGSMAGDMIKTPEQQAALLLLGASPNFVER